MLKKHSKRAVKAIKAPALLYFPTENNLTGLVGDLYDGMDIVSRELVGYIPSVTRNTSAERAAVGQKITWYVSPVPTVGNITPAMTPPTPPDFTAGHDDMTITKSRQVQFGWVGEQQRALNVGGQGYVSVQADNFAQALRALVNEMEGDLGAEAAAKASRYHGAAATIPFTTNVGESAQLKKILDDNGAPQSERSLIINTTTGAQYRTLNQLVKVNEAGTFMTLRDGELADLHGFSLKESAGTKNHTAGNASGATTGAAGYAIGATEIATAAAGSGNIVAGDVIMFDGDPNKYTVITGKTGVGTGTTAITIRAPGLRQAIPASATNITVIGSCAHMTCFHRAALQLAARAPALPQEGDMASDRMMITDPRSGMPFEVSVYAGYRMIMLEVGLAWGVKSAKDAHIAGLLGPI